MREILFRGKRIDNGEWVEGYFNRYSIGNRYFIAQNGEYDEDRPYMDFSVEADFFEITPETVGQYTGLNDKNGKKIFEGDIFKFPDEIWESSYTSCGTEWDSWETENYGVVGFDEYYARFDFVQYKYNENSVEADLHENNCLEFARFVKELEIVGNIHDNPELIGGDPNEN